MCAIVFSYDCLLYCILGSSTLFKCAYIILTGIYLHSEVLKHILMFFLNYLPNATDTGRSILTRILFLLDLGVI